MYKLTAWHGPISLLKSQIEVSNSAGVTRPTSFTLFKIAQFYFSFKIAITVDRTLWMLKDHSTNQ